jgi:hypothetical protein
MYGRLSLLMQVTTDPTNLVDAASHTGGWSEGIWFPVAITDPLALVNPYVAVRAPLLPNGATIVGWRVANFDVLGNKLIPAGTSTGKLNVPGSSSALTDLPQVALELSGASAGGPNTNRMTLRCIPDSMMVHGEYQPTTAFKRKVGEFCNQLTLGGGAGFVGRDKSRPSQRVESIAANVVKLGGSIGAAPGTDYMRFNRVRDTQGNPIEKVVKVIAFVAPGTYTVEGLDGITAGNSGTARTDALKFFDLSSLVPVRAVVRKIGRPFAAYRGRASKRRV